MIPIDQATAAQMSFPAGVPRSAQAEDNSRLDSEVDAAQRNHLPVALSEPLGLHGGFDRNHGATLAARPGHVEVGPFVSAARPGH